MTSGIHIAEVRIRNFRSLKSVDVTLDPITVLLGENNAGKTSFLEALYAAIGANRIDLTVDDIFVDRDEVLPPKERQIFIDLLIIPVDLNGTRTREFNEQWGTLFGEAISEDEAFLRQFISLRTRLFWSEERREYVMEKVFLDDWPLDSVFQLQVNVRAQSVLNHQIEPLCLYLLDAKRDMQDELQDKHSFWHRLATESSLTDADHPELADQLSALNEHIVNASPLLQHLQSELDDLYQVVSSEQNNVRVTPLPQHVRELNKGLDIQFATREARSFQLTRHGMGTRSLATMMTFRAFTTWRLAHRTGSDIHAFLALEEPEAHLHPQAQRSIFRQIHEIPGQKILSTHSPYVAGQADLSNFRCFRKERAETKVSRFDTTGLYPDQIKQIKRMVLNTRGELLFARAILLGEGETEEMALSVFAEQYWGLHPQELGISCIGVGGKQYEPFVRLAESFGIPWYIFSDAELDAIRDLKTMLAHIGQEVTENQFPPQVVTLPVGHNFETYMVFEGYEDAISAMLATNDFDFESIDAFIGHFQGQKRRGGRVRDYLSSAEGRRQAFIDLLSNGKTEYAEPLAKAITQLPEQERRIPQKVKELFDRMSEVLGLQQT